MTIGDDINERELASSSATVISPPPPTPPGSSPGDAATPGPAPKRKRTGLVVLLVVLVALCGLGSWATGLAGLGSGGDAQVVKQAEVHFSAMMSAVDTASIAVESLQPDGDPAKAELVVNEASEALQVGRDEIEAARKAIEQLDDSVGKRDYLAALDAANESLDGLEDLAAYLGAATRMLESMGKAAAAASTANNSLNEAIAAGNSGGYDQMKSKATSAAAEYVEAAKHFDAGHAVDESAGLDRSAAYVRTRKTVADVVVKMAADGKAGRTSAYNKGIASMKTLNAQAEKISEPEIVTDPDWVKNRLAKFGEAITAAATSADELRTKALAELSH